MERKREKVCWTRDRIKGREEEGEVCLPPEYMESIYGTEGLAAKNYLTLQEMEMDCFRLGKKEWNLLSQVQLTTRQTQCLWYFYWRKMTQCEIAECLNIRQPRVHICLKQAKARIAKHFGLST